MYTTVEDCFLHCENDDLAKVLQIVKESEEYNGKVGKEEDIREECGYSLFYAVGVAVLHGTLSETKDYAYADTMDEPAWAWEAYRPDPTDLSLEDKNCLNSCLHILHSKYGWLRGDAVEEYGQLMSCIHGFHSSFSETVYVGYDTDRLCFTGKDAVPDSWKEKINHAIAHLGDDVVVRPYFSWMNSHLSNGDDYTYNIPEGLCVDVLSFSREALAAAVESINKLPMFTTAD